MDRLHFHPGAQQKCRSASRLRHPQRFSRLLPFPPTGLVDRKLEKVPDTVSLTCHDALATGLIYLSVSQIHSLQDSTPSTPQYYNFLQAQTSASHPPSQTKNKPSCRTISIRPPHILLIRVILKPHIRPLFTGPVSPTNRTRARSQEARRQQTSVGEESQNQAAGEAEGD